MTAAIENGMGPAVTEAVLINGANVFAVREKRLEHTGMVTITMDGRFEWTFETAGWRPISFGSSQDLSYLWSARELIALPSSDNEDPQITRTDEDLLYAFRVEPGWILVCETSVRRLIGGGETDRVEFGEVVERASWAGDHLRVIDAGGDEHRVRVDGAKLVTAS